MPKKATSVTEIDNLVFVGRESYKEIFWEVQQSHARQKEKHHILVYYGIGGIGKSRLQEKLVNDLTDGVYQNFLVARVNLADLIYLDTATILYHLRSKLKQVDLPRFDFAYLVYYAKMNPVAKTQGSGFLQNLHLDILTPGIQSFITDTLLSGGLATVSAFIGKADENVKNWWDKNRYPELERLHLLEPVKMIEQLPILLARDLNAYLDKNNLKHPIFFFDTFENLAEKIREEHHQLTYDRWLRNLIIDLPRVLWVIFSRESLQWEMMHPEEDWKGSIYSHELKELSTEEADELFTFYKIDDCPIQQKIKEASQCHPLYLNLSIITYQLIAQERTPTVNDFGGTFQQIYECFIRHLTQPEADTFKILSCLQRWDIPLLVSLLKEFNQAYHGPHATRQISRFSFVSKSDIDHSYTLHQLMRDHLYEQFNRELPAQVQRIHQYCFDYLQKQLDTTVEIESKKSLILRVVYHKSKFLPVIQVYEWAADQSSKFDKAIHFDFHIQLLTPIYNQFLAAEDQAKNSTAADCMMILGLAFFSKGKYEQAKLLLSKAHNICLEVLGEDHIMTAISKSNLALVLNAQGKYEEAEPLYRRALEITEKGRGEEHADTAMIYNNLAETLRMQGKYEQAEPLQQKALKIRRQVLGESHPDTAMSYNNLGLLLNLQGNYEQAAFHHRNTLAIYQKVLGEEHPFTGTSYNNLALVLNAQGKYEEAETLFQKALKIRQQVLGEEHPDMANSYSNLALALNAQGKYEEAETLFQKALKIRQQVLGEEHPDTAKSYNNLAGLLLKQGKYEQAESFFQNALAIYQKILGEEHPDTATSYNNLAEIFRIQGKYEEAKIFLQKALQIRQKVLGEEHPDTATSYSNLAELFRIQGKYEEAEPLYQKALKIRQKILGEEHPTTAISYNNLALLLDEQGKYEEAELLFQKALKINQLVLGEEHPITTTSYNNLAELFRTQGKNQQAEALYKKALQIREQVLGEEHPDTSMSYNNLALLLNAQGKYEEAEPLFQKALKINQLVLGEEHPTTAISYNNLAGLFEAQNKYEQAILFYRKALKIMVEKLGYEHPYTKTIHLNLNSLLQRMNKNKK